MPFIDRNGPAFGDRGEAKIYAGEAVAVAFRLLQPDGDGWTGQDLSGRVFVLRVFGELGETLATVEGEVATVSGVEAVSFGIAGEDTAGWIGAKVQVRYLGWEMAEVVETDRRRVLASKGLVLSRLGASAVTGSEPGSGGAPATLYELRTDGELVLLVNEGAPGLSAYQFAVLGGFEGTAEEFAEALAENAIAVAENIAAINAAGATQTGAVNTAGATQLSAVNGAGTTQVAAVNAAGTSQTSAVNAAGAAQVSAVEGAGATQVSAVNAAGGTQTSAVNTAGATQVVNVNTAGSTQTAAVNAAGDAQVEVLETRAGELADALDIAGGELVEVIGPAWGYDAGDYATDEDGWTHDDFYRGVPGQVGNAVLRKTPGADWSGLSGAFRVWKYPLTPEGAIIDLYSTDSDGFSVVNRAAGDTPSANRIPFSTGFVPGATGATPTQRFATGPSGVPNSAVLVVGTAGQNFHLHATSSPPPAGQWTRGVKVRARPGFGPYTIEVRSANSTVSQTVDDTAWVTFSETFTASGSNHNSFYITCASAYEILVDEAQLVPGASLPDFATDDALQNQYMRNPGSQALVLTNDALDNTTWRGGPIRISHPADPMTITEWSHVATFEQKTASNAGLVLSTLVDAALGTTAGTLAIGATTSGRGYWAPTPSNPTSIFLTNQGFHTVSARYRNGNREIRVDGIELAADTAAFAAFDAAFMQVNGTTSTLRINGLVARVTAWPRYLDDDEMIEAVKAHHYQLGLMGITSGLSKNFYLPEGDSRSTLTRSSWTQYPGLLTGVAEFSPSLQGRGLAVAGSTLSIMVARLATTERLINQCKAMGIRPIVSVHMGTNDFLELMANPGAYWTRLKTEFIAPVRAMGARVIACTEYAQNETDKPGWAANVMGVGGFNDIIRADTAAYDALCDWSVDPIMGDAANFPQGGGTYSQDGVHPNGTGHGLLAPYMKASVTTQLAA